MIQRPSEFTATMKLLFTWPSGFRSAISSALGSVAGACVGAVVVAAMLAEPDAAAAARAATGNSRALSEPNCSRWASGCSISPESSKSSGYVEPEPGLDDIASGGITARGGPSARSVADNSDPSATIVVIAPL